MNLYNKMFILPWPQQKPNSVCVPEIVYQAMEAPATPTTAIVMAIAETADLLILPPQEK